MKPERHQDAALLLQALRSVLSQVAEPNQVLRTILDQAVKESGADRGLLVEAGPEGKFDYKVLHRFEPRQLSGVSGEFSRSILEHVHRTREAVVVENALEDPRFKAKKSVLSLKIVSVLCMPILTENSVGAIVYLENKQPAHFSDEDRGVLASLVEVAGPAIEALTAGRRVLEERNGLRASADQFKEEVLESRRVLARDWSFGRFVGRSSPVHELEATLGKVAATDFPVLICGETGTGKSILARVIHHSSARAQEPFVTVFCPSLEKGMVEAELFGHKKGAFTGAVADRVGKIQAAERGSLFLDEICALPHEIQPKLLRLLQEQTYERVGESQEREVDVRFIATTNRDLEEEVRAGRFRRDLFERLNFLPVRIPPLRERREDIPSLLRHCLDQHGPGRWVEIEQEALEFLMELDFSWPGNVRHIEQLAARITAERFERPVSRQDLHKLLGSMVAAEPTAARTVDAISPKPSLEAGLPALLQHAEKAWLEEALQRYPGLSRSELAEKLRISESALYKKLRLYGFT